jgi:hypothetical protein
VYVFYNDVLCEIRLSLEPSTKAVVLTICQQYAVQKVVPTNGWLSRTKLILIRNAIPRKKKDSCEGCHFLGYYAVNTETWADLQWPTRRYIPEDSTLVTTAVRTADPTMTIV